MARARDFPLETREKVPAAGGARSHNLVTLTRSSSLTPLAPSSRPARAPTRPRGPRPTNPQTGQRPLRGTFRRPRASGPRNGSGPRDFAFRARAAFPGPRGARCVSWPAAGPAPISCWHAGRILGLARTRRCYFNPRQFRPALADTCLPH